MGHNYLIDTHAHLDGEEFVDDLEDVLHRAKEANVKKIFIPNININSLGRIKDICKAHPGFLYPMLGLHPEEVNSESHSILDEMEKELDKPNDFIAIGEIGLDYYWDDTQKEMQKEVFRRQVGWAKKHNLPLVIHTRSAHSDMVQIMREEHESSNGNKLRGIFHCFAGTAEEAKELLEFPNFMIGIGGISTFKKSTLPEILKSTIPLGRIVLETDSPYMAPVPNRGKRNESSYIADIAQKLSEIHECSIEDITLQTTQNALSTICSIHNQA